MNFKQYLTELTSRPIPKEMAFPEAEYRRRVGTVRGAMAEKRLDALLVTDVQQPFVPGMTFLSPITLRLPGTLGIGFTETFAVTETGCELLTARDRALVVAPA